MWYLKVLQLSYRTIKIIDVRNPIGQYVFLLKLLPTVRLHCPAFPFYQFFCEILLQAILLYCKDNFHNLLNDFNFLNLITWFLALSSCITLPDVYTIKYLEPSLMLLHNQAVHV